MFNVSPIAPAIIGIFVISLTMPELAEAQSVELNHAENVMALEDITIHWDGPAGFNHYIDIAPAGRTTPDGEKAWTRLIRSKGPVIDLRLADDVTERVNPIVLQAPAEPGAYDIRYIAAEGNYRNRRILAKSTLTVRALPTQLSAPSIASAGERIRVSFGGANGDRDYVDIVDAGQTGFSRWWDYAYTRDGSPATMTAPNRSGDYDVRLIIEGPEGAFVAERRSLSIN
ncbi:MAG: hypothetical protein AAFX86_15295 [Pseudomonadota bacterium]